ncbi:MAG: hypothetical protein HPY85_17045 [Anaerolineae bacterium]|nr:hypothetical protein [Anaerolineae bacterium]
MMNPRCPPEHINPHAPAIRRILPATTTHPPHRAEIFTHLIASAYGGDGAFYHPHHGQGHFSAPTRVWVGGMMGGNSLPPSVGKLRGVCHNIVMPSTRPNRRSIRLAGFDYTQPGYYYLTLCTPHHQCLFGTIHDAQPCHSPIGQIAAAELLRLPERFPHLALDAWVVMPNHVHLILQIVADLHGTEQHMQYQQPVRGSIAAVARAYKAAVTRRARKQSGNPGLVVWQRGYWERVLRNERELTARRKYIAANPYRWREDPFFAGHAG